MLLKPNGDYFNKDEEPTLGVKYNAELWWNPENQTKIQDANRQDYISQSQEELAHELFGHSKQAIEGDLDERPSYILNPDNPCRSMTVSEAKSRAVENVISKELAQKNDKHQAHERFTGPYKYTPSPDPVPQQSEESNTKSYLIISK